MDEYKISIYKYVKIICLLGLLLQAALLKAQDVIDLSGTWGFQTDVMDFRRGSLSPAIITVYKEQLNFRVLPTIIR